MSNSYTNFLDRERINSKLPVRELTFFLNGGKEKTLRKEHVQSWIENEPTFSLKMKYYQNRKDELMITHEKCRKFHEITSKNNIPMFSDDWWTLFMAINDNTPMILHFQMFVTVLMAQADREQLSWWAKDAMDMRILGCYAQTEIGHGSNIRALETTATFDDMTDEFIIHSPTLSSTKFWVGALGLYSTHTIVFAQLIIKAKNFGIHPFMVQIRSLQDHTTISGINIGDIGPKFGFSSQDNGFMQFNHLRIPRRNMLMKYSQVDRQGNYTKPPHDKISYGGMIHMRVSFVTGASFMLSKAVTIAIRYSAQRTQFGDDNGEKQVLNYPSQQAKLMPLLATVYAYHFTGKYIREMYEAMLDKIEQGDYSIMGQFHSVLSGLKAYITSMVTNSIEVCRRACGGHGYSRSAGLADLYAFYVHLCTAEGENTLMSLQGGKFLGDCEKLRRKGKKLFGLVSYLNEELLLHWDVKSQENLLNPDFYVQAFAHASARFLREIYDEKTTQIDVDKSSEIHSRYVVVLSFHESLKTLDSKWKSLFSKLFCLYCMYLIDKDLGDFTADGFISQTQIKMICRTYPVLLQEIREVSVPLVDAFGHTDFSLNSVLGCFDGNYQQRLMDWVKLNPINQQEVFESYEKSIRPLTSRPSLRSNL